MNKKIRVQSSEASDTAVSTSDSVAARGVSPSSSSDDVGLTPATVDHRREKLISFIQDGFANISPGHAAKVPVTGMTFKGNEEALVFRLEGEFGVKAGNQFLTSDQEWSRMEFAKLCADWLLKPSTWTATPNATFISYSQQEGCKNHKTYADMVRSADSDCREYGIKVHLFEYPEGKTGMVETKDADGFFSPGKLGRHESFWTVVEPGAPASKVQEQELALALVAVEKATEKLAVLEKGTLKDALLRDQSGGSGKLAVGLSVVNDSLQISPEGYAPVLLDYLDGELRVVICDDINVQAPGRIINMSHARIQPWPAWVSGSSQEVLPPTTGMAVEAATILARKRLVGIERDIRAEAAEKYERRTATVVLRDQENHDSELKVKVSTLGGILMISPEHHGRRSTGSEEFAPPILLELDKGELKVMVWPNLDDSEGLEIGMSKAKESNRSRR